MKVSYVTTGGADPKVYVEFPLDPPPAFVEKENCLRLTLAPDQAASLAALLAEELAKKGRVA